MNIQDYKEATSRLMEFVRWSRKNYTRTPKRMVGKIDKWSNTTIFNLDNLSRAFIKLAQHSKLKVK